MHTVSLACDSTEYLNSLLHKRAKSQIKRNSQKINFIIIYKFHNKN